MPSWERCFSSPEQDSKCEGRLLKTILWCRRGWGGSISGGRGQSALAPQMQIWWKEWRLLKWAHGEHGKCSNSHCKRILYVSSQFWKLSERSKVPGEVLHPSGYNSHFLCCCCDESVSQEARLIITWSKGRFICGRNKKRETLEMYCHYTEVEATINFCEAIVSSGNN